MVSFTSVKHAGTTIDTRTYDIGRRMTDSSYNNGVSETRAYNVDNTLASISHSGASIGNLSYGWDDNKNKTSEAITGTMSGYGFSIPTSGYDAEDRLVSYNRTNGNLDQSWDLSAVGDWNSITTEGTTQSRTHGDTHELTAVAGQTVSNDTRGNTTRIPSAARPDSAALALTWDADNRLSSADAGNNSSVDVSYQFDALGRRVARTSGGSTTMYLQVGLQTIADYPSGTVPSSPTYRYIYGSYIDEPVLRYQLTGSQSVYYHRNQQFSLTALTGSSGSILERYAYSAYGIATITSSTGSVLTSSAHNNRYTNTGREWDEDLNLYHYRARMYDPHLGRFCSKDPSGYVGGMSLYQGYFVPGGLDPSGLYSSTVSTGDWLLFKYQHDVNVTIPSCAGGLAMSVKASGKIDIYVAKANFKLDFSISTTPNGKAKNACTFSFGNPVFKPHWDWQSTRTYLGISVGAKAGFTNVNLDYTGSIGLTSQFSAWDPTT